MDDRPVETERETKQVKPRDHLCAGSPRYRQLRDALRELGEDVSRLA
ncbi:MAG: hypothetical protein U0528_17095 [Anaerolineae bacterium]